MKKILILISLLLMACPPTNTNTDMLDKSNDMVCEYRLCHQDSDCIKGTASTCNGSCIGGVCVWGVFPAAPVKETK